MTQIWAHRGASAEAPENTLEAFELAVRQEADGIELDVQLSADGVLVVCHDETIDRTSDGKGAVKDLTLAELQQFNFNNGDQRFICRIPTIPEVLELLAPTELVLNVELKNSIEPYEGMDAALEAAVSRSPMADVARERIVYSSFNHRSLEVLATSGTPAGIGALFEATLVKPWDYARTFGATAVHPWWGSVTRDDVEACHEEGIAVHPWTVNDPRLVARLAGYGVDAIITDSPVMARQSLSR